VDGGPVAALPGLSYFAYDGLRHGVVVAAGDLDGDGMDEIITAPGPAAGAPAHIRGWDYDGSGVTPMLYCNILAWWPHQSSYGARVSSGFDLDDDGMDELAVAPGQDPSAGSPLKVYRYDGSRMALFFSLTAFSSEVTHGANPAVGRF
jgi:hypothetical protein